VANDTAGRSAPVAARPAVGRVARGAPGPHRSPPRRPRPARPVQRADPAPCLPVRARLPAAGRRGALARRRQEGAFDPALPPLSGRGLVDRLRRRAELQRRAGDRSPGLAPLHRPRRPSPPPPLHPVPVPAPPPPPP